MQNWQGHFVVVCKTVIKGHSQRPRWELPPGLCEIRNFFNCHGRELLGYGLHMGFEVRPRLRDAQDLIGEPRFFNDRVIRQDYSARGRRVGWLFQGSNYGQAPSSTSAWI